MSQVTSRSQYINKSRFKTSETVRSSVRKVFSDGAEFVLSEMLFHAEEAEGAKAPPTIVAWPALGMTRGPIFKKILGQT